MSDSAKADVPTGCAASAGSPVVQRRLPELRVRSASSQAAELISDTR